MMINNKIIDEVKNRLVKTYDPLAIYLFGSYAWGHPDEDSDLDLLIVIEDYTKDPYKTIADGYKSLDGLNIFKDIVVYNKKEFDLACADTATLCNKVITQGKQIYAKA